MLVQVLLRVSAACLAVLSVALVGAVTGSPSARAAEASSASAGADSWPAERVTVTVLLLRDSAVRTELKLSATQVSSVDNLIAEVEYPLFLLRDAAAKQRDVGLMPIQKQLHQKLTVLLDASQLGRLNQLVFQARGFGATISPENVKQLRLSKVQVGRITKINENAKNETERNDTSTADLSAQEISLLRERRATKQHEAIVAVLDVQQRDALAGMVGEAFDLSGVKWVSTTAPELRGVETWINSKPLKLEQLRGKVVVVHFWAFECSNCLQNLPHYGRWYEKFPPEEVTIIGIHTPETEREHDAGNLRNKVAEYGIKYPVAFDAAAQNWRAWANNVWPSVYLIDKQGRVRQWWYGELNWQGARGEEIMRKKIEELLAEK